ncbi:MAG: hypothetical protein RLZZ198_1183 [Bacteroidota bacterium]
MKRLLILLSWIFTTAAYAQSVVKISCIDRNSLEPIANVNLTLSLQDSIQTCKTNVAGLAQIVLLDTKELFYVSSEHPMYEPLSYRYQSVRNTLDTLFIKLVLKPIKSQSMDQVVVKAPGIPDTVFNSTEFHVADFEVTDAGDYILLVYPKRSGHKNSILWYDGISIKDSMSIHGIGINLIKDYRNNIHVICQEEVYHISHKSDSIALFSIPKDYFLDYVLPIVDTTTSKLFFSNFNMYYPAFDYFALDQIDSSYRKIIHIEDPLMMELYRSEYKWVDVRTRLWAKQKEIETGVDAQIWVGANYFTQSIYYKVPFAPLFKIQDSIYVLDFQSDQMTVYTPKGEVSRTTPLLFHYHKDKSGWKRVILKDESTQALYALFEKDGISMLGKIDLTTGKIVSKHRLYHKYVEKIRIHQGNVYYIYRPFESIQKRFLYKERLFD